MSHVDLLRGKNRLPKLSTEQVGITNFNHDSTQLYLGKRYLKTTDPATSGSFGIRDIPSCANPKQERYPHNSNPARKQNISPFSASPNCPVGTTLQLHGLEEACDHKQVNGNDACLHSLPDKDIIRTSIKENNLRRLPLGSQRAGTVTSDHRPE